MLWSLKSKNHVIVLSIPYINWEDYIRVYGFFEIREEQRPVRLNTIPIIRETKKIAIPYREIEEKDVEHLKELFQKKASAFEIVSFVNSKTLELQMPKETISKLEAIRIQLIKQRRR